MTGLCGVRMSALARMVRRGAVGTGALPLPPAIVGATLFGAWHHSRGVAQSGGRVESWTSYDGSGRVLLRDSAGPVLSGGALVWSGATDEALSMAAGPLTSGVILVAAATLPTAPPSGSVAAPWFWQADPPGVPRAQLYVSSGSVWPLLLSQPVGASNLFLAPASASVATPSAWAAAAVATGTQYRRIASRCGGVASGNSASGGAGFTWTAAASRLSVRAEGVGMTVRALFAYHATVDPSDSELLAAVDAALDLA